MVSVLGWVTIQGLDVDAVATNTQKRRNGASNTSFWGKKNLYRSPYDQA